MESFERLATLVEETRKDMDKADRGNKAAGTRVRKAMQEVKTLAQEVRKSILGLRPAKESAPSEAPQPPAQQPAPPQTPTPSPLPGTPKTG